MMTSAVIIIANDRDKAHTDRISELTSFREIIRSNVIFHSSDYAFLSFFLFFPPQLGLAALWYGGGRGGRQREGGDVQSGHAGRVGSRENCPNCTIHHERLHLRLRRLSR